MSEICPEWEKINPSEYKGIWVYMQVEKDGIHEASLQMLSIARMLAEKKKTHVAGVLIGYNVKKYAKEPIYCGADEVYVVDDKRLERYYAKVYAHVLVELAKKYKISDLVTLPIEELSNIEVRGKKLRSRADKIKWVLTS